MLQQGLNQRAESATKACEVRQDSWTFPSVFSTVNIAILKCICKIQLREGLRDGVKIHQREHRLARIRLPWQFTWQLEPSGLSCMMVILNMINTMTVFNLSAEREESC